MIRDRHPSLPRWGLDGGNGSVVSVEDMDEKNNLYRLYTKAGEMGVDQQYSLIIWLLLDLRSEFETKAKSL